MVARETIWPFTERTFWFVLEFLLSPMHQANTRLHLPPWPCWVLSPLRFCFIPSPTDYIQISASGSASWQEICQIHLHASLLFCYLLCVCIGFKGAVNFLTDVPNGLNSQSLPSCSFGLELLLKRDDASHLCNPNFSFYHLSNRVSVTAWVSLLPWLKGHMLLLFHLYL